MPWWIMMPWWIQLSPAGAVTRMLWRLGSRAVRVRLGPSRPMWPVPQAGRAQAALERRPRLASHVPRCAAARATSSAVCTSRPLRTRVRNAPTGHCATTDRTGR